jgi:hypothetical protein
MQRKSILILIISLLVLLLGLNEIARAQETAPAGTDATPVTLGSYGTLGAVGTAFTYQGQLKDADGPVSGNCDFHFGLWDALTSGAQVGTTLEKTNVTVSEGLFTVQLDFGSSAFAGSARWLEIAVRCPAGSGSYTTLAPRQPLTPAPNALYAVNAGTAANLSGVLSVTNGGTGSATQNFVDLSTAQTVAGAKTFSSAPSFTASGAPFSVSSSDKVTNLNADLLDGQHAVAFQQHYQNLVVVAKSGGDYTTITDALNSITTNSAGNPFTIYVAPGIYSEMVTMKPYVDIEGAGEQATKITFTSGSTITSTLTGADNAELRFLTVESTGGGTSNTIAIYNHNASPRITHVTATATNRSYGSHSYGIYNSNSSPMMTNMNVYATAFINDTACGVHNDHSSPAMTNVIAIGDGGSSVCGVENISSSPVMMNVTAKASTVIGENYESPDTSAHGVSNDTSSPAMTNVTAVASGGDYDYGVYNYNSSPVMTNVTATASGGNEPYYDKSYGVYNSNSSPVMTNVTATASGGSVLSNYGVVNEAGSSPTMISVTANASGGTNNYGVYNASSSPKMTYLIATASGGTNDYGMWNDASAPTIQNSVISGSGGTNDGLHNIASSGSYMIKIDGSQITGGTSTIYQDSHYTTQVGASKLVGGGAQGSGIYKCASSYDGNYNPLTTTTCKYP